MKIYDIDDLVIIDLGEDPPPNGPPGEGAPPDGPKGEPPSDGGSPPSPGEEPSDSNDDNDDTKKGAGDKSEDSDEDGEDNKTGSAAGEEDDVNDVDDDGDDIVNKISKEIQDVLDNRVEQSGKDLEGGNKSVDNSKLAKNKSPLAINKHEVQYKPTMNWSQLVKLFTTVANSTENTRTKITGKSATAAAIGHEQGATAMPPAQRKILDGIKLVTVFDTSGSMSVHVKKMLTEVHSLVIKQSPDIVGQIGVLYYADNYVSYALDVQDNVAWPISNLTVLESAPRVDKSTAISANQLMSSFATGGTTFSPAIAQQLIQMGTKGYNVLLGTDADILWPENWANFVSVFNALRGRLFMVCATLEDFQAICEKIGFAPEQFTILGGY